MSKPGGDPSSGISLGDVLRLPKRHPVPEKTTEVILSEIERAANTPLPREQRRKRMVELRHQIDELQRQGLALGADTYGLPPAVILGARLVQREQVKRVERHEHPA
jgi:hypothetical protein